ncbi:hypothetical protein Verru16b_01903 [Lacunisphaera limnophila]|uniref:Uncharacterized protein n=1 Tax=Lacunisphaera limnophila TaxID=1838286 RepID=A0A1D8AVA4_9BACT|nr:hypothetical protein Verru16b_01903 [Lacunisphaera limnophila]
MESNVRLSPARFPPRISSCHSQTHPLHFPSGLRPNLLFNRVPLPLTFTPTFTLPL